MRLEALHNALRALFAETEVIAAVAAPTDEQITRIRAIPNEMIAIRGQIEALEAIEGVRGWATQAGGAMPILASPNANADPAPGTEAARVSGGHDRATDRPWGYDLGVRMVTRPNGMRAFGGIEQASEAALGECLQAIFRAAQGGRLDPRLAGVRAASGGNTTDPASGGFSVGTDLTAALMQMGMETSKLLPLCTIIPVSENSDGIEAPYITHTSRAIGSQFGGVVVYRRGEADTVTATKPSEELFELRLQDLMGIAYQTDRLMSDARMMGQIYAVAFRNAFAWRLDYEIIRGTGVGMGQGVLNSSALNSAPKETGQAAATFTTANISDMWVRLFDRAGPRTRWFYNREVEPQLDVLSIPAGTAALEPRFVNYGPDGILRIKGVEAMKLEQCSALGTQGDVLLLDLAEMVVVTKGVLEQAESDHVRFIYGERTFRWTQRINNKTHWRTTEAPAYGSVNVSPFVALDTRA